jgi:rod shape determining protein RodA
MIIMGWFNIYAAVYNDEHKEIFDFTQRYGKQFIWILASILLAIIVMIIDNRFYLFFSWAVYGTLIFLLLLVLFIGKEVNGARSWFEIGSLSLQPSEFAKFATALALANYLNDHRQELARLKGIIPAVAIIMIPAILTAAQPDMGSTIVFFSFFIVFFQGGNESFYLCFGIAGNNPFLSHTSY